MKSIKLRLVGLVIGSLSVYLILFNSYFINYVRLSETARVNLGYVVVHLDLKGSPPKLKYLESLLPTLKKFGVNGLLMEYEDTFPYEGVLANLSSTMPYNKTELKHFITKAAKLKIEIIPLIQTFGHMEHVLKLEEFMHLREREISPDSICPSRIESIELLKGMLEQVIYFHSSITSLNHIHIGCDEVYEINKCKSCRIRQLSERVIFIDHVRTVRNIVRILNPHTTVLMWDDMFREMKIQQWSQKTLNSFERVEPVCWDYTPDLTHTSHINLYRYHKTFNNIWIATAFKGADGKQALLPNFKARFQNHFSWMKHIVNYIFASEKKVFNFKGVILTGWSRYSHLDPLCELLPASLPILMMNLLLIQKFKNGINVSDNTMPPDEFFDKYIATEMNHELKCKEVEIEFNTLEATVEACMHKSSTLISLLKQFQTLEADIDATFKSPGSITSLVEYYSTINNLNVNDARIGLEWCKNVLNELKYWRIRISTKLMDYYEKFVIEEYVGYKTYSVTRKIDSTLQKLNKYLKPNVWDRRSYNFSLA